eukprot:Nitzschia sp. Nitz4//scaffold15_size197535//121819//123523//NITZ4_001589-RA/size197535-augustus-gene-0.213-mRNA-1//1//CDS//3329537748//2650//frame0
MRNSIEAVSVFSLCSELHQNTNDTDGLIMLECVSDNLEAREQANLESFHSFLFVLAGAMIFFMQAGFATLCAGAVRIKNVQNTMLKNLLDACGAAVAFYLVGYAFAFGENDDPTATTFIGTTDFVSTGSNSAFWFFQYTFSATSVTIVAGTLAERCQMSAYLWYSVMLVGFVYPVVAHSIWSPNGFLSRDNIDPFLGTGAIDFAGSGVVHITGGTTALYATCILGPRRRRFYDAQGEPLETPLAFPGHSMALQLLGTMILWFGWFGFNGGSALLLETDHIGLNAANAAVATALSGACGGISALFTHMHHEERRTGEVNFSLVKCMNGALGGLVAVTAGCVVLEPWSAMIIGFVAGWFYLWGSDFLIKCRVDDAVDAIPVHMVNGIWGMIAVGLFASPDKLELAYGDAQYAGFFFSLVDGHFNARLLGAQVCSTLFIVGWTLFTMLPFFIWLNYQGWLRADSLEELVGLDISYHGGTHIRDDGVKKSYVDTYQRHRANKRNGYDNTDHGSFARGGTAAESIDPDNDQQAAALEAFDGSESSRL